MAKPTALNNEISVADSFRAVAHKYRFKDVTVNFLPLRDLKVRWVRGKDWIQLEVSDYLAQADPAVASGLADTIFQRMMEGTESQYSGEVISYLTSPEFLEANQSTYIRRTYGLLEDDGSLQDSYRRLVAQGLVNDDPDLKLYYNNNLGNAASNGSMLMHTIQVNDRLRSVKDDEARDYALYKSLAPAQLEFNTPNRVEEAEKKVSRFPNYKVVKDRVYDTYGLMNTKPKGSLKDKLLRKVRP